jgi:hypothetical protein
VASGAGYIQLQHASCHATQNITKQCTDAIMARVNLLASLFWQWPDRVVGNYTLFGRLSLACLKL